MTTTGGRSTPDGLAQDAGKRLAFVGHLHALARRAQMRQRELAALDRLHVRGLHLREVLHEQELAEVIVDAGALQVLARADELLVARAPRAPSPRARRRAPTRRAHQSSHDVIARGDLLEVGERDAVGRRSAAPNAGSRT